MAKNFANLYASANDSSGIEQRLYIKEEPSGTRGTLIAPLATDFILQLSGGNTTFNRPIEPSAVRSGRHNFGIIEKKDVTEWSFPFYFMIDTTLGAAANTEIDPAARVLYESLLGRERDIGGVLTYDAVNPPDITFSIWEVGDVWAHQAPGAFVMAADWTFPGDGEAQHVESGQAKTMYRIGIMQSVADNNGGNTVTVNAGEGKRAEVNGMVQLIEGDGTTRSADTPDGSPRRITAIVGDVITLDGAALADADGSGGAGTEIYLTYYEPDEPLISINDPVTGLVGSITIAGLSAQCVRSAAISFDNQHEPINYCYGERGLAGPLFSPTGRLLCNVTLELNLNAELVGFINSLKDFDGEDVTLILGDATGRHMEVSIPKWTPPIPGIPIPESGTIPVSFEGLALQTATGAGDEILVEFK